MASLVAKKKPGKQIAIRFPGDPAARVERAADMLGLDVSQLIRMVVIEGLPEYERRGRRARGINGDSSPGKD